MKRTESFFIFCLLMVSLVFSAGSNNADFNLKLENGNGIFYKLASPLRDVVEIYRECPKLTLQNIAEFRFNKLSNLRRQSGMPVLKELRDLKSITPKKPNMKRTDRKLNGLTEKSSSRTRGEIIMDALIWPEVQERWNNPPYDVLKCNIEVNGDPYSLQSSYLKIRSVVTVGDRKIAKVEMASIELEYTAEKNIVLRIEPILKKALNNDLGTLNTGASRMRRALINNIYTKGYTGRGVIVGVIDTGIDWSHEDFIDPETNTSRILYIWDMYDSTGPTPAAFFGGVLSGLTYGTVWTKADIDNGLCTSLDTNGHGTHVCGSAAGNGYATGRYTGMAPNADIIIVKGLDNNGILFIYEMASMLGQPCAVNMSYGPSFPLHYIAYLPERYPADGTSLDAQFVNGLNLAYGPGYIPVKAAGNDGHWNTYNDRSVGSYPYMVGGYHSTASLSSSSTHTMETPDYASLWSGWGWGTPGFDDYPFIQIGLWYESPIQVSISTPNGYTLGPMVHGSNAIYPSGGDAWGTYWFGQYVGPAANGYYYGIIYLEWYSSPATEPPPGQWQITVTPTGSGTGNIDMWVADFNYYYAWNYQLDIVPHVKFLGDNTHTNYIIDEGASPYEICVGSWVTRTNWTDINGDSWTFILQPWLNDISSFSSPGPSRDRRLKPDVGAPGAIIISAASKDAPSWTSDLLADPQHGIKTGTSMAAPHVTGGVAMILEKFPTQDVDGIRTLIASWARNDNITALRGSEGFGYGKFNVLGLNDPPVAVLTADKTEIGLDDPDKQVIFDGSNSYDPERFGIAFNFELETEILVSSSLKKSKPASLNYSFNEDGSKVFLIPDPYTEARYTVVLTVNDSIDTGSTSLSLEAKFYPLFPPTNATLERIQNNLIFYTEYINRISWLSNPANKGSIKYHRIYRKVKGAGDNTYELANEISGDAIGYDDRGLKKADLYSYRITTVNYGDKESDPVMVSN